MHQHPGNVPKDLVKENHIYLNYYTVNGYTIHVLCKTNPTYVEISI